MPTFMRSGQPGAAHGAARRPAALDGKRPAGSARFSARSAGRHRPRGPPPFRSHGYFRSALSGTRNSTGRCESLNGVPISSRGVRAAPPFGPAAPDRARAPRELAQDTLAARRRSRPPSRRGRRDRDEPQAVIMKRTKEGTDARPGPPSVDIDRYLRRGSAARNATRRRVETPSRVAASCERGRTRRT